MKRTMIMWLILMSSLTIQAETRQIPFSGFDTWITRKIKESFLVGGKTVTLYEVGPTGSFDGAKAFTNQGGCPWANSNVYAKVAGVVKTNLSVYPDDHEGNGKCAKLCTQIVKCKAVGIINVKVLAAGSLFTGSMIEPITSSSNPMSKINLGIPFTHRPKAIQFDYKYYGTGEPNRIRETGFSKAKTISGPDMGEAICLLQRRWEDAEGNIHALRVGTMRTRFNENTNGWVEKKTFPIHYGDISHESFYHDWMGLVTDEEHAMYALNSKGKNVKIIEEGWAEGEVIPTHIIVKFDSSHGGAYVGSVGNTLWVDNVKLIY